MYIASAENYLLKNGVLQKVWDCLETLNQETEDIKVISTIYDSIYVHLRDDLELIKYVNDLIIPFLTKDFLVDQIVHNEAEGEVGYNWYDTAKVHNNASIEEIQEAVTKAKELINAIC